MESLYPLAFDDEYGCNEQCGYEGVRHGIGNDAEMVCESCVRCCGSTGFVRATSHKLIEALAHACIRTKSCPEVHEIRDC